MAEEIQRTLDKLKDLVLPFDKWDSTIGTFFLTVKSICENYFIIWNGDLSTFLYTLEHNSLYINQFSSYRISGFMVKQTYRGETNDIKLQGRPDPKQWQRCSWYIQYVPGWNKMDLFETMFTLSWRTKRNAYFRWTSSGTNRYYWKLEIETIPL